MAKRKTVPSPRSKLEKLLTENATLPPEDLIATGEFGSRNTFYDALKRGDFETFRVGRLYRVVCAPLRKMLGIEAA